MTSSATSDAAAKPSGTPSFRFPRAARLRRARDIRRTMRTGRRIRGSRVDVFSAPSPAGRTRIAVVVPRHGRTAVARNRVRRRLLEIARTVWLPALSARELELDLIMRAKPPAYEASYRRLRDSLTGPLEAVCAR